VIRSLFEPKPCTGLPKSATGTTQAPTIVEGSRNSGSEPPGSPPCSSRCRTSLPYILLQTGSVEMPASMPTNRPKNASPICEMLKPWLLPNTSGKAPKKRYRIPNRMADKMQRLKHYITTVSQFTNQNPTKRKRPTIGSKKRSWNGRMHDHSTVLAIDLSIFSIGAIHSGLPVSFRSRIAFRRRRTGWYVSGTKRTIRQSYEASISLWYTWCAAQSYLNSRPDDEDIETPDCILTNRRFARKS
jgi:hypothetical protein